MKLTLMAPFRVHFCLDSRALSHIYPGTAADYFTFWDKLAERVADRTEPSGILGEVAYLHSADTDARQRPEYFSIAEDTDVVPAASLIINPRYEATRLDDLWRSAMATELEAQRTNGTSVRDTAAGDWCAPFSADPSTLRLTVFDNTIAIIETTFDIAIDQAPFRSDPDELQLFLRTTQGAANRFIGALVDDYYARALHPFLLALYESQPPRSAYLLDPRSMTCFRDLDHASANGSPQAGGTGRVKWVTRTLHLSAEERNAPNADTYRLIARRWLADTGAYSDAEEIIENKRSFSFRWVNYLHWPRTLSVDDTDLADGWEATLAYEDAWDALKLAQYFYATVDALNINLSLILGSAYSRDAAPAIRNLNDTLADITSRTKLVILNFREREKYLVRAKLDMLRSMIFAAWDFDGFVTQTEEKAKLCEERIQQIHNKSSERNGFVTDILLLLIGTVSFFGLALDIARSAREFSTDATVGLRDEGLFDILSRISSVPMDTVIGVAFISILGMVIIYGLFRWRKLL